MKRKYTRGVALETAENADTTVEEAKRRRRGGVEDTNATDVPIAAPRKQKRRGRPPSQKTLEKRQLEAERAAQAAAASEAARCSPTVHHGPSVEDQVKRLQADAATDGQSLGRRRSCSLDCLYAGSAEVRAREGSRLRHPSSAADSGGVEVEIQVEEISDAEDDQSLSQPVASEAAAAASNLPAERPEPAPLAGQPAAADAARDAVDMDVDIRESTQGGEKPAWPAEKLSEGEATGPWPSAAASDAAVSLSASKHETPSSSAAHIMPKVDAAAVPDMLDSKPSAFDNLPQAPDSRAAVASAALTVPACEEHGVNGKATPGRSGSTTSHHAGSCLPSPGSKRGPPKSSAAYIPLGKAAVAKQEAEAKLAAPKGSSPKACAHAASAAAGKAAKRQPARGGAKSMLQLDSASRPASRKRPAAALASEHSPVSQASPQPAPQASGSPAQSSAKPQASSRTHPSMAPPSGAVTQAASSQADRVSPHGSKAAKSASPQPKQRPQAPPAKQTAARIGRSVMPRLTEATKRSQPPQTAVIAIKAEQPALSVVAEPEGRAEAPHIAPKPAKIILPLTSRLTGILGKPERPGPKVTAIKADIPVQAAQTHKRAELEEQKQQKEEQQQQREEQRQQREEQGRADEQRRVLREIEAGLNRVTVSAPAIREMTSLVLQEDARGLEPRIVRSIVERIEQKSGGAQSGDASADVKADGDRKVALLYVLDSVLKKCKFREESNRDMELGLAKSAKRFCNAVAVGLPTLVRATLGDRTCYEKTLKVFQVWLQRGVLAQKVLEPHMQQLQQLKASSEVENHEPRGRLSARETGPPAMSWLTAGREEIMQGAQLDEFGMKLADDDSDDEGGWDADGDAPTLGELPVLPQVEEAHKPPWQLSGGTDRAVGTAPGSPEASPWHQGPSPTVSLPELPYLGQAGTQGPVGSETPPDLQDKAARAPWHQPAPAAEMLLPLVQQAAHASVVQQPPVCALAPALYPHQIAYQQQQALRPPQQLQMPQQARPPQQQHIPQQLVPAPYQPPMQARLASWQQPQRAGSYDSPSSTLQPFMASHSGGMAASHGHLQRPPQPAATDSCRGPITLPAPGHTAQPARPITLPPPQFQGFAPPLPPEDSPELPPLPDEAPPPLPEGAPPPLPSDGPADMDMESSRSPGFFQQSHPYQQPVYSYGQ